ncbi:unnamed protein product, partial [Chrysoparadoxa australica]
MVTVYLLRTHPLRTPAKEIGGRDIFASPRTMLYNGEPRGLLGRKRSWRNLLPSPRIRRRSREDSEGSIVPPLRVVRSPNGAKEREITQDT